MESSNDTTTAGGSLEVPLVVSYLKLIIVLLAPLVLAIPTGLVLRVIATEERLQTKYYFLVSNLLITDFLSVVAESLLRITGLILHVAGSSVELSCSFTRVFEIPAFAAKLMFAALGIDRFVAIAYPYQHRQIMTNKVIIGIIAVGWGVSIAINSILASGMRYVPAFAKCFGFGGLPLGHFFQIFVSVFSTLLIVAINIYLYRQILESNRKHQENMQLNAAGSREANNYEMLKSHIKPAVSVLLLGGLDGIFNLAVPITFIILRLIYGSNSLTRLYFIEFLIYAMEIGQVLCHPLVYGIYMTPIRQKLFDFELYHRLFNRRSRVVGLNNWY